MTQGRTVTLGGLSRLASRVGARLRPALESRVDTVMHRQVLNELRDQGRVYRRQKYFDSNGNEAPIEAFGDMWRGIKRRKGFNMRRGHALASGMTNVVGNPATMRRMEGGADISPDNMGGQHLAYWRIFADMKAPTLMNFRQGYSERLVKAMRALAVRELRRILGNRAEYNEEAGSVTVRLKVVAPAFRRLNNLPKADIRTGPRGWQGKRGWR